MMKTKRAFKFNGWWYILFTSGIPIILFTLCAITPGVGNNSNLNGFFIIFFGILGIPLALNLMFGPSIIAFWCRKKSRWIILTLNILGFLFCLGLQRFGIAGCLLWWWALAGRVEEQAEEATA
jgi:hypothetical protein